jgi:hypothetical protein
MAEIAHASFDLSQIPFRDSLLMRINVRLLGRRCVQFTIQKAGAYYVQESLPVIRTIDAALAK